MSEPSWFAVVSGTDIPLRQGDLVEKLPIVRVDSINVDGIQSGAELPICVEVEQQTIIVSQSCDLENNKISDVLLAQVLDWNAACAAMTEAGNKFAQSIAFRKALIAGNIPALHLLHKRDENPSLPWSIVDFHRLFVVPKALVLETAFRQTPRLTTHFAISRAFCTILRKILHASWAAA
jgi:hypothetical protein